jgi:hypothetical protein
MFAVQLGHGAIVDTLLAGGASVDLKDGKVRHPLQCSAVRCCPVRCGVEMYFAVYSVYVACVHRVTCPKCLGAVKSVESELCGDLPVSDWSQRCRSHCKLQSCLIPAVVVWSDSGTYPVVIIMPWP